VRKTGTSCFISTDTAFHIGIAHKRDRDHWIERTKKNLQQGRSGSWPVGDPNLRLSHREIPRDYPYMLTVSTYIMSFLSLTGLHFILTFLPTSDITLSWLAILNT